MPRSRPPYPPEFRREAVQLVLGGRTVKDVSGALGCSEQSLHNWMSRSCSTRLTRLRSSRSSSRSADVNPSWRSRLSSWWRLTRLRDLFPFRVRRFDGPECARERLQHTAHRTTTAQGFACDTLDPGRRQACGQTIGDRDRAARARVATILRCHDDLAAPADHEVRRLRA
jgi:transposase